MRAWLCLGIAALACKKDEASPKRGAEADALWDLAPDDAQLGWVATPRAVQLAERGVVAVRKLVADPDLARIRPAIDATFTEWFGAASSLADLGLDRDKGFAMFGSASGALLVIPVGNRDKFVAAFGGTRGETDAIRGLTCRPVNDVYACATTKPLLARLGKQSLRGKLTAAGERGDIELYALGVPLGKAKADVAVAFELEPGQVALRGTISGVPTKAFPLAVAGTAKPDADRERSSGFAVVSIGKLPGASDVQITPLVTVDSLMRSIKGPITASVPAGSLDVQVRVPLVDPAPMAN